MALTANLFHSLNHSFWTKKSSNLKIIQTLNYLHHNWQLKNPQNQQKNHQKHHNLNFKKKFRVKSISLLEKNYKIKIEIHSQLVFRMKSTWNRLKFLCWNEEISVINYFVFIIFCLSIKFCINVKSEKYSDVWVYSRTMRGLLFVR